MANPLLMIALQYNDPEYLRNAVTAYLDTTQSIVSRIGKLTELEALSYHIDKEKGEMIRKVIAEVR